MKQGANHLVIQNMRDDYPSLVSHVRNNGQPVNCDGELSYELRNVLVTLIDPYDAMPLGVGSKFDPATAANDFIMSVTLAPERESIAKVERQIRGDHTTRSASVAGDDRATMQFLYRDEKLQLHVSGPSADVVQLPYGLFALTQLQITMANVLGIEAGAFYFHSVTLYLGAKDTGLLDYLKPTTVFARPVENPHGLEGKDWEAVEARANFLKQVADGIEGVNWETFTQSELWYLERLGAKP